MFDLTLIAFMQTQFANESSHNILTRYIPAFKSQHVLPNLCSKA